MPLDDNAKKLLMAAAKRQVQVEQRALEVFSQLLKIPEFNEWMKQHIVIRDEVDHEKKQVTTYVIYKEDASGDRSEGEGRPS
jgi:hypothetical protein